MFANSFLVFCAAFISTTFSVRKIIYIAHKKNLFDEPTEDRKVHTTKTPNLGGAAIFLTLMLILSLSLPSSALQQLRFCILSSIIIFMLGLLDDIVGINPNKKIIIQLLAAAVTVLFSDFRITTTWGLLGAENLPYYASIIISVLFIVLITNAFNLIDGIDCLAGSIGLLVCVCLSYCFWRMNDTSMLIISTGTAGCLGGFLLFNKTPAKIFMGDTGSLFTGFIIALLSIRFAELNKISTGVHYEPVFKSAPSVIAALLVIPVFDTLRVFFLRLWKKKSPFTADRNHIHHRLIDLRLSHLQATGILLIVNIIIVTAVFMLQSLNTATLFSIITVFILAMNQVLSFYTWRKPKEKPAAQKKYSKTELATY